MKKINIKPLYKQFIKSNEFVYLNEVYFLGDFKQKKMLYKDAVNYLFNVRDYLSNFKGLSVDNHFLELRTLNNDLIMELV